MNVVFSKPIRVLFVLVSVFSNAQAMVAAYEREVEGVLSAYMYDAFLMAYQTCSNICHSSSTIYQSSSEMLYPPDPNEKWTYPIKAIDTQHHVYSEDEIVQLSKKHTLHFVSDVLTAREPQKWSYITVAGTLETSGYAEQLAYIKRNDEGVSVTIKPLLPAALDPVINGMAYLLYNSKAQKFQDLKDKIPHLRD
jgi:hypothetical protein